jgi:hypothetical protein
MSVWRLGMLTEMPRLSHNSRIGHAFLNLRSVLLIDG